VAGVSSRLGGRRKPRGAATLSAMAVVMPNCSLSAIVRSHPYARDARGRAVPTDGDGTVARGPFPGYAAENSDGSWRIRGAAELWPLQVGDAVTDGTRVWAIAQVRLIEVPGAPDVDSVSIIGTLEPPKVR